MVNELDKRLNEIFDQNHTDVGRDFAEIVITKDCWPKVMRMMKEAVCIAQGEHSWGIFTEGPQPCTICEIEYCVIFGCTRNPCFQCGRKDNDRYPNPTN